MMQTARVAAVGARLVGLRRALRVPARVFVALLLGC